MALYKVLTAGLYQRESGRPGEGPIVPRYPGDIVEVSDAAAPRFVDAGIIEPLEEEGDL